MYNYKFTQIAVAELDKIRSYIIQQLCNPKAADNWENELFDKIDNVRKFPKSGLSVDNEFVKDTSLRKFFAGNYTVIYKTDDKIKTIIIVCIYYSGRDDNEILKSF